MTMSTDQLFPAVDRTWPPARFVDAGAFLLREGRGGGKRVSAATAVGYAGETDITQAEVDMEALGQTPLFMIRAQDDDLDRALAARGYEVIDPVDILTCTMAGLTDQPIPPLTAFVIWEPLAVMEHIWAQGGIGPARIDVMHRASVKTAILARHGQRPAGTAFVAAHDGLAVVHAVEVLPDHRRAGLAGWMMRQAAFWAQDQGASTMVVLCTKANTAASALYSGLGFEPVAQYHYRQYPQCGDLRDG